CDESSILRTTDASSLAQEPSDAGRLHRMYHTRVPHLRARISGQILPPPSAAVHYSEGVPTNLGTMLNDSLGDCTCGAVYHAFRFGLSTQTGRHGAGRGRGTIVHARLAVITRGFRARDPEEMNSASLVICSGVVPAQPVGQAPPPGSELAPFWKSILATLDDVKRAINDCGLVYIGFNVPQSLTSPGQPPSEVQGFRRRWVGLRRVARGHSAG